MNPFKFFQKPKPVNTYLSFDMDKTLINVLKYIQYHNQSITNNDINMLLVGVPINNCWLRITGWSKFADTQSPMIEINYSVIEINTRAMNFVFRMEESEFLRRIDITGI